MINYGYRKAEPHKRDLEYNTYVLEMRCERGRHRNAESWILTRGSINLIWEKFLQCDLWCGLKWNIVFVLHEQWNLRREAGNISDSLNWSYYNLPWFLITLEAIELQRSFLDCFLLMVKICILHGWGRELNTKDLDIYVAKQFNNWEQFWQPSAQY